MSDSVQEAANSSGASNPANNNSSQVTPESGSGNVVFKTLSEGFQTIDGIINKGITTIDHDWLNNDVTKQEFDYSFMPSIFGLPYQFSDIVDVPPLFSQTGSTKNLKKDSSEMQVGSKFIEKIISVAPIMFLSPGEPEFLADKSNKNFINLVQTLAGINSSEGSEVGAGKYYTFRQNSYEYSLYVNLALQTLVRFMGIENLVIYSANTESEEDTTPVPVRLGDITMQDLIQYKFAGRFSTIMDTTPVVVPFYVDAITNVSDSFSNGTTQSQIASTAQTVSSSAREAMFLIGGTKTDNVLQKIKEGAASAIETIGSGVAAVGSLGTDNLIDAVSNEISTIIQGGKMIFPEIWSDSSYGKSYRVDIKLRSPDPDPVSIFLNIFVPIIFLMSMAVPRQIERRANAYQSPFLVRALYKSFFECNLGIIDSLDISRGGENCWNALGQPTSVDVSISIKDLYSSMFISNGLGLMQNTAQLDYLADLAGIIRTEDEYRRKYQLIKMITYRNIKEIPRGWLNWGSGAFRHARSYADKIFGLAR